MNSILLLRSLKTIQLSKTCTSLKKCFIKRFTQYYNVACHNFQRSQKVHTSVTEVETSNEIERKASDLKHFRDLSKNGPSLKDFLAPKTEISTDYSIDVPNIPYINDINGSNQKVYFEVYGCQMNVNDTEVVWSILKSHGYEKVDRIEKANIILLVTCAIRDNAEQKIWNKLDSLRYLKKRKKRSSVKIGLLGCMAERLKNKIIERDKFVDVIAGPDSYKDLPRLLSVPDNETAINVVLSFDETYADITPNVNSYRDTSQSEFYVSYNTGTHLAKGFKTVYKDKKGGRRFCDLLDEVSRINPEIRIRFTSPHPKDFPDEVLQLIAERPNICKEIHLPAQSGNSVVLERMRRGYTRESYIDLVHRIREIIPNIYLSSDFITGFCGETEEEFQDTLSLMELVKYNRAFLFSYSMREKTTAHRRYKDDVAPSVKQNRLERMISTYRTEAEKLNKLQIGQLQLVLVDELSKRSNEGFQAKNDGNTRVVISSKIIPTEKYSNEKRSIKIGDYVVVKIQDANSHTLTGIPLYHSSIAEFASSSAL
ncbi:(Dimethylallyl)adenosine tRNA methylthiotransferase MiaB [Eufriesea mexicana]|uniref:(Dimethylallyl)adenosine tRNA methylthiotransferase MiaB n=1 Tax=Eufriesea mexicana TaxID=516756 RepID=A0A310SNX8_9HYME|nr:(Dimethylallyl)adenosine tRNA methylthiotransferase MiaB [Eufriesea mexicana]